MIKLQDMTPAVYYDQSRDFQFIGRLFDLVLNSLKTEADLLFNLPLSTNSPDELLELMTLTFGLQLDKNKYTNKQLRAICSVVPKILRNKGSLASIELLCAALLRAEGIEGDFSIEIDNYNLAITMPPAAQNKEIIAELLPYILPAGMTFTVRQAVLASKNTSLTVGFNDTVEWCNAQQQPNLFTGNATSFEFGNLVANSTETTGEVPLKTGHILTSRLYNQSIDSDKQETST